MTDFNDFFFIDNTVNEITSEHQDKELNYIEVIKAFSRCTYESIYLIDYQTKNFEYVSQNPLFLCGHTATEVKEMGYAFYYKYVIENDLKLLLKINTIGFDFFNKIPIEERKEYTISYDFHIKNQEGKIILLHQKLTPIYVTDTGKIWKAVCIVSLSTKRQAGNIKIFKKGSSKTLTYNLEGDFWETNERTNLTNREKEILQFSTKGYTINEIADSLFISPDTVKFHRKKLFDKLNVTNISEAIMFTTINKLI